LIRTNIAPSYAFLDDCQEKTSVTLSILGTTFLQEFSLHQAN
jgi:hypothetical protein